MRHGESQNNVLAKISAEAHRNHRTYEPELSQLGAEECRMVGAKLTEMGIRFDMMLTSAHKRAILSLKNVRETYQFSESTPCAIMTQIHEEFGVNMGGQTFPGLTRSQVLELMPELQISEEQGQILTEDGWFRLDHIETQEELTARVKLCVNMFKDMAKTE